MPNQSSVTIRPIQSKDLQGLWQAIYQEEFPEWKRWDAPYYPHEAVAYETFLEKIAPQWVNSESMWVIETAEGVVGTVTYYYEDDTKMWVEMGIIIYEGTRWGKGYGTIALRQWMDHLFTTQSFQRLGITTWSGNERMMRVGEKLGMQLEGRIRNVRFFEDVYYDSIRMGILREEWLKQSDKSLYNQ